MAENAVHHGHVAIAWLRKRCAIGIETSRTCVAASKRRMDAVCGTCLARHFRYQMENGHRTTCALCRVAVDPQDTRSNKAIDVIVQQWKSGRRRLLDVLREHEDKRLAGAQLHPAEVPTTANTHKHAKDAAPVSSTTVAQEHAHPVDCTHSSELERRRNDGTAAPSKRVRGEVDAPPDVCVVHDDVRVADGEEVPPGMGRCPVCGIWVLEGLINSHVDTCLTRAEQRVPTRLASDPVKASKFLGHDRPTSVPSHSIAPKRVPKLNFHMLSDKGLKRHLQHHGLSLHGTRKELESRYKEFELRVNAYVSQGVCTDHVSVAKEVEKLERDRKRACASDAFHATWSGVERDRSRTVSDAFQRHVSAIRHRRGSHPHPGRVPPDVEVVPDSDEDAPPPSPPSLSR